MNEGKAERTWGLRHDDRRGSISPVMAVVGLVAVVAVVAAVGYATLSEFGGGGTSNTLKSCDPPSAPQCQSQNDRNGTADVVLSLIRTT